MFVYFFAHWHCDLPKIYTSSLKSYQLTITLTPSVFQRSIPVQQSCHISTTTHRSINTQNFSTQTCVFPSISSVSMQGALRFSVSLTFCLLSHPETFTALCYCLSFLQLQLFLVTIFPFRILTGAGRFKQMVDQI